MAQALVQAVDVLFIIAVVASVGGWVWLLRRRAATGRPLVEPCSQREPFWSLAEFFICFGLFLVCSVAASVTAQRFSAGAARPAPAGEIGELPATTQSMVAIATAGSTAYLLVLSSMLVWMGLTQREFLQRYGFWPNWGDVKLGLVASLLILPPVLGLADLLSRFIPYEHPVLDAVKQHPTLSVFVAMTFSAAIAAPLFEEFMFRALLQGGAQKVVRRLSIAREAIEAEKELPEFPEAVSADEVGTWAWGPVVISSATFAIMHLGHGAAPIALFFFALALGYLYRQTGRLWPCIVVHFMLNAFSMAAFGLQVAAGQ